MIPTLDLSQKRLIQIFSILIMTLSNIKCGSNYIIPSEKVRADHHNLVTKAESFTKLVIVDSLGVTGADGVISFPLNDNQSIFMMGDSFLTPVRKNKRDVKSPMINNSFILINKKRNTHTALYNNTSTIPDALIMPNSGNPLEYYWPGHGFHKNGILHIFMSRFLHGDYDWGFKFSGTDYIRLNKNTFEILSQQDFPYSNNNNVHYGHSLLNERNETYIYGAWSRNDSTAMHVAKATLNLEKNKLDRFVFFDGRNWTSDPLKSKPLSGIHKPVPEQFSVFKQGDVYVLILQVRELGNGNIYSYISESPTGPWKNEKLLYQTTEQNNVEDQIFTYNAMAHPQYTKNDKLLISYCINSFDVKKIHEVNTDYYRPKFIWVPLKIILE
tara:strand:+ start:316 stop:1467 length:1152 start_codon:yes stop_codon:yes gene_type:complete